MNVLEGFSGLRTDLDKMAYAAYFAEAASGALAEDEFDDEVLRLILNTLYALEKDLCDYEKIKTVFEWRLAATVGYAPQMKNCGGCGCSENIFGLSLIDGTVFCRECLGEKTGVAELSGSMRKTIEAREASRTGICRAGG